MSHIYLSKQTPFISEAIALQCNSISGSEKDVDNILGIEHNDTVRLSPDQTKPLVNAFTINPIAHKTRLMNNGEFNTLTESIRHNTQLLPILLWWNVETKEWELVDGRHRVDACNVLRIKVKTFKFDKKIKEEDLSLAIFEIQVTNKIIGETIACCEAVLYLEDNEHEKAASLVRRYDRLKKTPISRLTLIRKVKPLWFDTLRNGDKVDTGVENKAPTDSIYTLWQICKAEEEALGNEDQDHDENSGDPEWAEAYSVMEPQVDAILAVVGKSEKKYLAMQSLISRKSKLAKTADATKILEEEIANLRIEILNEKTTSMATDQKLKAMENLMSEMHKKEIINPKKLHKLKALKK